MTIEDDARRYIDGAVQTINARDWEGYGAFFAEDVQMRFPGAIDGASGREARVQFVQVMINAFPDGRISAVRVFGSGDWGCCQFQFEGTNTGPLGGPDGSEAPPTGKVAAFPYCVVARFEGGIIVEFDEYFDRLEMLSQLGLAG
ncbi:MAG: ester cyclase [Chloroflexota bacterium]|nr:ester cyclase [Chloroflexota bacterium]